MSQKTDLPRYDADGEQLTWPRNWDAHPAGSTMPEKRRQSILDILTPRTDILTIILEDQNCIHVRNNQTHEVTVITEPGMAQIYVDSLDGKLLGGPI